MVFSLLLFYHVVTLHKHHQTQIFAALLPFKKKAKSIIPGLHCESGQFMSRKNEKGEALTSFWYLNKGVPLLFKYFSVIAPVATLLRIRSPRLRPLLPSNIGKHIELLNYTFVHFFRDIAVCMPLQNQI